MQKIRTVRIEELRGKIKMWQTHKDYPGIERLVLLGDDFVDAPSFQELEAKLKRKRTIECY